MKITNPFIAIPVLLLISVIVIVSAHTTLVGFLVLGFKPLEMLFENAFSNSPIWQYVAANIIILASSSFIRATFGPTAELQYGDGLSMNLEAFFVIVYHVLAIWSIISLFFGYLLPNL